MSSACQWRGWYPRQSGELGDEHRDPVDVAPAPALPRLQGADQRVVVPVGVRGRVPVRRAITTADMAAFQADAQMLPRVTDGPALLAARHALRQSAQPDVVAMAARHGARRIAATALADIARTCG
jgi:hypothetical protein